MRENAWIPTAKMLPIVTDNYSDYVLTSDAYGRIRIMCTNGVDWFADNCRIFDDYDNKILYWMPLSALPSIPA